MKVFFAKHGQIPSTGEMRITIEDEGLSKAGIIEATMAARDLRMKLEGSSLCTIISSPRKRALETAEICAEQHGLNLKDIEVDARLLERDCTAYAGQLIGDVFSKPEKELVDGGMESLDSIYIRTQSFYDFLISRDTSGAVLIVGHSGNLLPLTGIFDGKWLNVSGNEPQLSRNKVLQLK